MKWIILPLIAINMAGFLLMAIDKIKAKYGRWRIKESILLCVAVAFGAIGVYTGLILCRHKTKHRLFTVTLPVLICIQAAVFLWLAQQFNVII